MRIQAYGSVAEYARDLRQFSARERSGNPFVWPAWPLSTGDSIARWTSEQDRAVPINIRWTASSSQEARRQAAIRYRLQVPSAGPLESGRFTLLDTGTANGAALINDPAIEDTSGIDRTTGEVYATGWYLGPIRLLNGLDTAAGSAAFLFFVFLLVPAVAAAVLLGTRRPEARSVSGNASRSPSSCSWQS